LINEFDEYAIFKKFCAGFSLAAAAVWGRDKTRPICGPLFFVKDHVRGGGRMMKEKSSRLSMSWNSCQTLCIVIGRLSEPLQSQ
jgi:hypothetical protein